MNYEAIAQELSEAVRFGPERIKQIIHRHADGAEGFLSTFANINDTCRTRGFVAGPSGSSTEDRVIALAQAFDALQADVKLWQQKALDAGNHPAVKVLLAERDGLKAAGVLSLSLMYGFLLGVPDDDIEQSIRSTIGEMELALIAVGAQADVDRIREGHSICMDRLEAAVSVRSADTLGDDPSAHL